MTEKEENAIKTLKEQVNECKLEIERLGYETDLYSESPYPYKEIDIILQALEQKEKEVTKILSFINKQARCYDRKIKTILNIKSERNLKESERRDLRQITGRKEECIKIESKIQKILEKVVK